MRSPNVSSFTVVPAVIMSATSLANARPSTVTRALVSSIGVGDGRVRMKHRREPLPVAGGNGELVAGEYVSDRLVVGVAHRLIRPRTCRRPGRSRRLRRKLPR